jgi:Rod binding domain-containing protein
MDLPGISQSVSNASLSAFQSKPNEETRTDAENTVAAKQFESLMATMLVKEMRKSLPEGFFGAGPGSDSFNGWMDKSIGDSLASSWDLDIAGMVKTSLDSKQARAAGGLE